MSETWHDKESDNNNEGMKSIYNNKKKNYKFLQVCNWEK